MFNSAFAQFKGHCSLKTKIQFEAKKFSIYDKMLILQFPYMKKYLSYNFHYEKMFILQFP